MLKLRWAMAALALPIFTGWASAGEPALNQQLANQLAGMYRTSGQLRNYDIDIRTQDGVVTLSGSVDNHAQLAALETMTNRHPSVRNINNNVQVRTTIQPVANLEAPRLQPVVAEGEQLAEPAPINAFAGGVAPYSDAPVMPPYAWPAYTPYNNYASMAYQTQYPSGAWPFIGPPHPYPMIPSGWRRVTLKWKKGYWWMNFKAH